jgi:hypothetical protein
MQVIKTLDTNSHTYYCGYISKYEISEAEKKEVLYMIKQKSIGFTFAALMILPAILLKEPKILLFTGTFILIGLSVGLTNQRVTG